MSNKTNIINSIKNHFINSSLWTVYTYIDSSIDTTESIIGRAKIDLPLGTEISFIFQVKVDSDYYDAVNPDDTNYLLYRYILRTKSNGTQQFKRIDSYNSVTGLITLESAFGEAVETTDELQIVVLDSLFIDTSFEGMLNSPKGFRRNLMTLEFMIKTKQDSKKEKMRDFIEDIQEIVSSNGYIVTIYNIDGITTKGFVKFEDEGRFNDITNSGDQLIFYRGTFDLYYYIG